MRISKTVMSVLLLVLVTSCTSKTSTPKEYLNQNKISRETYLRDKSILKNTINFYIDSIDTTRKPKPKRERLSIEIDTIFYGSGGKIAFLCLSNNKNPYVIANRDSIQFIGECFIALKSEKDGVIKIVKKLKYRVTTSEIPNEISKNLRDMYLKKMGYIDKRYNINDIRFWDSDVWKQDYN
jgi:hypothetical protein